MLKEILKKAFENTGCHRNDKYGALIRAWAYVFLNYLSGYYIEFGVFQSLSVKLSMDAYKNFSS